MLGFSEQMTNLRMENTRKPVLAIVAGIRGRDIKDVGGSGQQSSQPANGVPGIVRSAEGRSNHDENRWRLRQFTWERETMAANLEETLIAV
jgi:hypothetical protein